MLKKSSFVHSVLVLSSGTAFAHALQAASLPILTRVYSPADFQTAAVFQSILFIVSVAACLRFDIAVALAKNNIAALHLVVLSLLSCSMLAGIGFILLISAPKELLLLIGNADAVQYFWLLPVGIFFAGAVSTIQNWHIREKSFRLLSFCKVTQTVALVSTQVGSGLASLAPTGLILGNVIQLIVGVFVLGKQVMFSMISVNLKTIFNAKHLFNQAKANYKFPLYSTWEALANVASIQLPVVIIARLAIGPEAGYLLLAMTVMQAPLAILGTAIGQVFLSRASHHFHSNTLGNFTAQTIRSLSLIGFLPLLGIGLLSPIAVGFAFGPEWSRSGWLILWMTPWFFMQFIASPASMALHVTGHQRAALILQLLGLFIRVAAVLLAFKWDRRLISEVYAFSGFVFYYLYLRKIMSCTGCSFRQIFKLDSA